MVRTKGRSYHCKGDYMTSSASTLRLGIAQDLADLCPAALGEEILLAGSVAHGRADAYSDIEQVFFVSTMPSRKDRDTWLNHIGAEGILHDEEPLNDHSLWSTFRFRRPVAAWIGWLWAYYFNQIGLVHWVPLELLAKKVAEAIAIQASDCSDGLIIECADTGYQAW